VNREKNHIRRRLRLSGIAAVLALAAALVPMRGQAPNPAPAVPAAGRGGGGLGGSYNPRPAADPAQIERGKALYGVQCTFCHGADARGGEGGPNLWRSVVVLNDINGEMIAPVVQNGRPDQGMPKFDMNNSQISDIAAFLHTFNAGGRDVVRNAPPNVLVGDAKAGEAYFKATCAPCHSITGDLKGIGAKVPDPKTLQQTWLMPSTGRGGGFGAGPAAATNVPPKTVTVTVSPGRKYEGQLERIDDFTVTLLDSAGVSRTFARNGDKPAVEVHDPLKPHKDLLGSYTDKDIHNVTAYLATVK